MWFQLRDCGLVQFNCSVVTLWSHGLQHARLPCPSRTPAVYSNSCPLSWWCHPTICGPLLVPPSNFPSIRVFSNESALRIRWPKFWSVSFNISPSNEYLGLISFSLDWLGLLAVQGILESLLQHHSSNASILHSAFFIVLNQSLCVPVPSERYVWVQGVQFQKDKYYCHWLGQHSAVLKCMILTKGHIKNF